MQVDVLKLKADMWDLLAKETSADTPSTTPSASAASRENTVPKAAASPVAIPVEGCSDKTLVGVGDGLSFQEVINTLAPGESADVTTPFYFVCMLHLANEHGLTLQGQKNLRDFKVFPTTATHAPLATLSL